MVSSTIDATSDEGFRGDVVEADLPVLVEFWAVWSRPCGSLRPHLEALATEFAGRLKVVALNIDEHQEVPMRYQIRSVPTLLLFKGGEVVDQLLGHAGSGEQLARFVSRHLEAP